MLDSVQNACSRKEIFATEKSGDLSPPKNRLRRFFKLRSNQGFYVHQVHRVICGLMYIKTHLAIKKMKGF